MVLSMVKRQTLHQNGVDMTGKSSKEKKLVSKLKHVQNPKSSCFVILVTGKFYIQNLMNIKGKTEDFTILKLVTKQ